MRKAAVATATLGPEWDSELLGSLRAAVAAAGGTMTESSWAVGGSQEVATYQIDLPGGRLLAESETYVGLSIAGPSALVEQLSKQVRGA